MQFHGSIPPGWSWATLGDLADVKGGLTKNKARTTTSSSRHVPYLRVANVQRGYLDLSDVAEILATHSEIADLKLLPGDVLLNEGGDRDKLGRGWVWRGEIPECIYQNHVFRARRFSPELEPRFLSWYGNSAGQAYFYQQGKHTTNLASISLSKLRELPIPIAPPREQTRIVEALESYISRLDDAEASLERASRNLDRYRASVLKAAVEGRLVPTEAELARAGGRDYEPAAELLKRILAERRRSWEKNESEWMSVNGKHPRDKVWKTKYKEPVAPDPSTLPPLPDGWAWASVDQLAETNGGITKNAKTQLGHHLREIPYLRVANVQRGHLDLAEVKRIRATEAEIAALLLRPGDVLLNEGGDRDKLGRGWVWNGELPECIHQNHVFRARLWSEDVRPKFLSHYANTQGQRYFNDEGKQTTNLASISLSKLRALPVAIPPTYEQDRIIAEVERLLSVVDEAQVLVSVQLGRTSRLRQAVLRWAFEGRLVDQNPDDEPASVLLGRLRAEKAGTGQPRQGPTGRRPRNGAKA